LRRPPDRDAREAPTRTPETGCARRVSPSEQGGDAPAGQPSAEPTPDTAGDAKKDPRTVLFRYRIAPEVRCEYMASSVEGLTGYAPAEFFADPHLPWSLVHPDDLPLLLRLEIDCRARPRVLRWVRRDGQVIWTEHYYTAVRDDAGDAVAIEGMARDITAERAAENPSPPVPRGRSALRNTTTRLERVTAEIVEPDDEPSGEVRARAKGE
jgi:PAS domain S-box-containing protein